jgi:hypothetical protein
MREEESLPPTLASFEVDPVHPALYRAERTKGTIPDGRD